MTTPGAGGDGSAAEGVPLRDAEPELGASSLSATSSPLPYVVPVTVPRTGRGTGDPIWPVRELVPGLA